MIIIVDLKNNQIYATNKKFKVKKHIRIKPNFPKETPLLTCIKLKERK